jgi:hypothetical protein
MPSGAHRLAGEIEDAVRAHAGLIAADMMVAPGDDDDDDS